MVWSRRGCGKCGKAEAFFTEAFPSNWWKSSRGRCRRQPLSISTVAAFSTAPLACCFIRLAVEEPNIRNGKNSSKIRDRIQTSTHRPDRGRANNGAGSRAQASAFPKPHRLLARSVPHQRAGRSSIETGAPVGSRKREAKGQDRRSVPADGAYKKIASLGSAEEKRRYIRDHRQELGSISKACQVAGLAPSSYYYKPNQQYRRQLEADDERLRQQIDGIHKELPGYGCRRLSEELKRRGQKVGKTRIRRVMKKFGLQPIVWKTFVRTTDSHHQLMVISESTPGPSSTSDQPGLGRRYHLHPDSFQLRLPRGHLGSLLPTHCRLGYLQTDCYRTLRHCFTDGTRNPPNPRLYPSLRSRRSVCLCSVCAFASSARTAD